MLTPILKHPNRRKPFVVILHANPWVVSAVLGQEYDGIIHPARFTSRTMHGAEVQYHSAEKYVFTLLRFLTTFDTIVNSQELKVYTR